MTVSSGNLKSYTSRIENGLPGSTGMMALNSKTGVFCTVTDLIVNTVIK
jgi:hypothetical protein